VYGNKYDVNTDVGYGSLSTKKWEKQGCMTKQGQGGQDGIKKHEKCWQKSNEVGRDYVQE